jgi:hypothetical protein
MLLTLKPATEIKFAELMITHRQPCYQACRNPLSPTTEFMPIYLVPSKLLTVVKNLFCA